MAELKEFPTLTVASVCTGFALGKGLTYSLLQECASHLYGDSLYTHEIVHNGMRSAFVGEAMQQFPEMPSREDVEQDISVACRKVLETYGQTIEVRRGTHRRDRSPVTSLHEIASDKDRTAKGGDA